MALEQKTVRSSAEYLLDAEVNKKIDEGWEIASLPQLVIRQTNNIYSSSNNEEIWFQTLKREKK